MNGPLSWSCYGKLWDEGRTECGGGFDLAFKDPRTGSRLRKKCSAFDACKLEKESAVNQYRPPAPPYQPVIPSHQLVRPPQAPIMAPPIPPPVPIVPSQAYGARPVPVAAHAQQFGFQNQVPPWVAQTGPQVVPVQYQQPGAQMPAYLAVPEPVDGTVWWIRLLAEILRSMAKAFGHSTASFFDHNPMRQHSVPQAPQPVVVQQQQP
jgi:hypothetical protein